MAHPQLPTVNRQSGCLFCLQPRPSTRPEHIIPEGLGNTEKVLPPGVVCDHCNHGVLATLDAHLLNSPAVLWVRTVFGIRGKDGRLPPAAKYSNGTLFMRPAEDGENPNLVLNLPWGHRWDTPDGFKFKLEKRGVGEKHWSLISRALMKIGLELVCLDHGRKRAMSPEFDIPRRIVRDGRHEGVVIMPAPRIGSTTFGADYQLQPDPRQPRKSILHVVLHVGGLELRTHSAGATVGPQDQCHSLFGFDDNPVNRQSDYLRMTVGLTVHGETIGMSADDPEVEIFDIDTYRR